MAMAVWLWMLLAAMLNLDNVQTTVSVVSAPQSLCPEGLHSSVFDALLVDARSLIDQADRLLSLSAEQNDCEDEETCSPLITTQKEVDYYTDTFRRNFTERCSMPPSTISQHQTSHHRRKRGFFSNLFNIAGRVITRQVNKAGEDIRRGLSSAQQSVELGVGQGSRAIGRAGLIGWSFMNAAGRRGRERKQCTNRLPRRGRPPFQIVQKLCEGLHMARSNAEAAVDCPRKSNLCKLAGEVADINHDFQIKVDSFTRRRLSLIEHTNTAIPGFFRNLIANVTLLEIFSMLGKLERLGARTKRIADILPICQSGRHFTAESVDLTYDPLIATFNAIAGSSVHNQWSNLTGIELGTLGLGVIYNMANLIRRNSTYHGFNGISTFSAEDVGDTYRAVYGLSRAKLAIRRSVMELNSAMYSRGRSVTKFGEAVNAVRRFSGRYEKQVFNMASVAFCVYDIVDMTLPQVEQTRQQLLAIKANLTIIRNQLNANLTDLGRVELALDDTFTKGVAEVTLNNAGLIVEAVQTWGQEIPNMYQDRNILNERNMLIMREFVAGRRPLGYETLQELQAAVFSYLQMMKGLLEVSIQSAKIIDECMTGLLNRNTPNEITRIMESEGIVVDTPTVLIVIAGLRPELDFYYGWPICQFRKNRISGLDWRRVRELPKLVKDTLSSLATAGADVEAMVNMLQETARSVADFPRVSRQDVLRILAQELYPGANEYMREDLTSYRQLCNTS